MQLNKLLKAWQQRDQNKNFVIEPLQKYDTLEKAGNSKQGELLLKQGKVGCIIVAGGQATRLGSDKPKGCFEIFPNKSLFRIFAEKTLYHLKQSNDPLPLAIMTSIENHEQTIRHFEEHHFFGLNPSQVSFFQQGQFPFLDEDGIPLKIFGPSGNGTSLFHFMESGIGRSWHKQGIDYVNFVQIDNPLADPFDPALLGYHHNHPADITLKAIRRKDPLEKLGLIVLENKQPRVIEYNEVSEEEKLAHSSNGNLRHLFGSISSYCFNLEFIRKLHDENALEKMPLHIAYKIIPSMLQKGYKFEYFIFDVLAFAKNINVLVYPRELCFAALKESSDLNAVRQALEEGGRCPP